MLSARDLSLRRGPQPLFEQVNFSVHRGDKVGITGANGAGKSSLFAAVRGELAPDRGDLELPAAEDIAHVEQEIAADQRPAIEFVLDGDVQLRATQASIAAAERADEPLKLAELYATLEAIDGYRAAPDSAPSFDILATAANQLATSQGSRKPDPASARALREFIFDQKQLTHSLLPTDFLALAQSRLDTGDMPGTLELLHRLTLQPGNDPYSNIDSAASLLESANHPSEAILFLAALVQSVPWNPTYRLRLGEAELKAHDSKAHDVLQAVARDASAPYAIRLQATKDLGAAADLGCAELDLIAASDHPSPAAARQPYFTAARLAAASAPSTTKPDRIALLREAIAIAPNGAAADRARLDLLQTFTAADSSSAILALYGQIANVPMQSNEAEAEPDTPAADDSADESYVGDDASGPGPMFFPAALASTLDRTTQIRLAVLLASAFNREHNTAQSLFYDQLAVNIDAQNPKPDPVVVKRLADYKATLALEQKNAQRRPIIHNDLDQPNQVRPRLTLADQARAEAP